MTNRKITCKKCLSGEEILIPDFTHAEKIKLSEWVTQSALLSIKYIKDNYAISYHDAKFIVNHINKIYSHCNRCNFEELDGECIACPKCGALNFNWKRT